jgi:immune inhibitor A
MKLIVSAGRWSCRCGNGHGRFACRVPPSPDVMATLYMEYKRSAEYKTMSFAEYLAKIKFVDPSVDLVGMDDEAQFVPSPGGPLKLDIPKHQVQGEVKVKALLVDFEDRPGTLEKSHYEDLLFSKGTYPTGSMRDFYKEASHGKVDVTGSVHGWLRMPQPYSYYTNGESGMQEGSYPRNAQRLAEDAVKVALATGVKFDSSLDKFNRGIITALFIIHSGRGAEEMQSVALQGKHIWSHKWNLKNPIEVAQDLSATIYLTVPNDCKVGVCAHELGHLAFEWQDFYDPNYNDDGTYWDGTGMWDLMASGSYNGNGARPAHPAPLHKLQHGWVKASTITASAKLTMKPYTATSGEIVKVKSPKFRDEQYLLLENRKKVGFDFDLPGEGLLVWKVDERKKMNNKDKAGLVLVQADGSNDLNNPNDGNQGDAGDPFPGSEDHFELSDLGLASTSFPGTQSGISLKNIKLNDDGVITLDISFAGASRTKKKPVKKTKKSKKAKKSKSKQPKKSGGAKPASVRATAKKKARAGKARRAPKR